MAERMAGDAFRNKLEERIGTEEYDRISPDGHQDVRKGGRISAAESIAEFRERADGVSVEDKVAEYQGMVDSGQKFNNKAQSYLEKHGINFPGSGEDSNDIPDPVETNPVETEPVTSGPAPTVGEINIDTGAGPVDMGANPIYGGSGGTPNSQTQVVNMDNDQTSVVNGDGNTVTQNQDNIVSQNGFDSAKSAKAQGMKNKYILNLLGA